MEAVNLSPREIVSELDRFIVGQNDAKRAVSIALRNRWRRQQWPEAMQGEVVPKNILMIGPTGCGKTEIARRLARLANAPFIKVEATKFTEVGYVGRDVDSIIRDLLEVAIAQLREAARKGVQAKAELAAEERLLTALVGEGASGETRMKCRRMLRAGEIETREIEVAVADAPASPIGMMEMPGMPPGMQNMQDQLAKMFGKGAKPRKMSVAAAREAMQREEADKLLDEEALIRDAVRHVENNGIVFLDEIDKIVGARVETGPDVSGEGVQRDLLPIVEGSTVMTRYGPVKTDHILWIAAGAFHKNKPSDLIPELQGRFPLRVELDSLTMSDFKAILCQPEHSLTKQYQQLLGTEEVTLEFTDDGIEAMARYAQDMNERTENIGARRLHTIMEKVLEDLSFDAVDFAGQTVIVDASYVNGRLRDLVKNEDLSKYIL